MKNLLRLLITIFLCVLWNILYSQITITEIQKTEERIVAKPSPYDSLHNWELQDRLYEYKRYIGAQIYLPPMENRKLEKNFLFTTNPSIINTNVINSSGAKYQIYTPIYKPYCNYNGHISDFGSQSDVVRSDSAEICNTYFTVLNVFYKKELDSINNIRKNNLSQARQKGGDHSLPIDFVYPNPGNPICFCNHYSGAESQRFVFLLRNNKNNDSVYCTDVRSFILVPYFLKQKELFQNSYLIYDDLSESLFNEEFIEFDTRFLVKYEDDNGIERSTGKKVLVKLGSKWICSEVTLLKPDYRMRYILQNSNGEQIALYNLKGFILENEYIKRESEKKMQAQQLQEKRKQEEQLRIERLKKDQEIRRNECIRLFGEQLGELIAQGKVKIGMTQEMCKYAWGIPIWTNKTTTTQGVYEHWYFWFGYSLHFTNGILMRIEE